MHDTASAAKATAWLASFSETLDKSDIAATLELFAEDCYWRDLVAFTWNVKTMEGKAAITLMLEATLATTRPSAWQVTSVSGSGSDPIQAWFRFQTRAGQGSGIFTLEGGKCRTILTTLQSLDGHEEAAGAARPMGVRHGADRNRETWLERRESEEAAYGNGEEPYCLIIGGGQAGIMLGARLRQLGVPTVIVEKNQKAGDSWRNRYRSLVLHDPVWYDHLPYIPFPANWPVFTPKDKMGDWLEMYVKVMELSYWGGTDCLSASFDEGANRWTVKLLRDGVPTTLKPAQLVFATGAYGPPKLIELAGAAGFRGQIVHSSQYSDGSKYRGKKVAVIGAASSGHDVAVDLWEAGAEVTMIQRSATTVVRSETLMELAFDIYSEQAVRDGIDVDKADMIAAAVPFALQPPRQRALYDRIRVRDAEFYRKLEATGFLLDFGPDETGLMMKAYRTGSGYYVDVGASQLIIDGEIRIKAGMEIETLTPTGIRFADGSEIAADAIIQSTGFQSMHEVVANIVSREVADEIGACWGLGSGTRHDPGPWHGELRNMYKPVTQPNLWLQGGNLALSRFFSKFLALQIKARLEGIDTPVYRTPLASPPEVAALPFNIGNSSMYDERLARLRERLVLTGTDLVAVGPSSHLVWLAGMSPHGDERPVMLIVSKDHAGFLMPALNADSQRPLTKLPFYTWADADGPDAALAKLLDDCDARRAGIKIALDETMRADFALLLIDALPGASRTFLDETVGYLRASKDKKEYEVLKRNAVLNDGAMRAGFAALTTGITEKEVAQVIRDFYAANGAVGEFVIVCFGENGAFPHHHTGARKLKPNEAVLIDIGGRKDGYPSDMTRVGVFGETPTDFDNVHAVLERAVRAALKAAKPGVAAKSVDKAARDVITEAGYGPNFLHRTGHGLGIDIHEPPYITATSETVLQEGHVFSIEPGIYLAGRFGVRLEDIVIIRENGAEVLSELPRAAFRAKAE